jgi:hypothetical protein
MRFFSVVIEDTGRTFRREICGLATWMNEALSAAKTFVSKESGIPLDDLHVTQARDMGVVEFGK